MKSNSVHPTSLPVVITHVHTDTRITLEKEHITVIKM